MYYVILATSGGVFDILCQLIYTMDSFHQSFVYRYFQL